MPYWKETCISQEKLSILIANQANFAEEPSILFLWFKFGIQKSGSNGLTMSSTSENQSSGNRTTCDGYVQAGLTGNKTIQFLIGNLVQMGCTPPEGFIQCMNCEGKPVSGGFGMLQEEPLDGKNAIRPTSKKPDCTKPTHELLEQFERDKAGTSKLSLRPEIYLCEENVTGPKHANTILIHELIHAIDLCRAKMDPLRNCMQLACTEIRAENLSGECNLKWEFLRGKVNTSTNVLGHGKECAKRRAIDSVRANPNCTEKAALYVDAAMERCYADTFPFERHPNQQ